MSKIGMQGIPDFFLTFVIYPSKSISVMGQNDEIRLKDAINQLLDTYKLKGKLTEQKLVDSWERLMGHVIARHTQSVYIKDKKLILKLDSSVLRQELGYAKSKIIQRLNEEIGQQVIEDVVFH